MLRLLLSVMLLTGVPCVALEDSAAAVDASATASAHDAGRAESGESSSVQLRAAPGTAGGAMLKPNVSEQCAAGELGSKACDFRWRPALRQAGMFLTIQHVMNMPAYNITHDEPFLRRWFQSVDRYRFGTWTDDDPFIVDYIGHPMMGAVTGFIQVQNDPRGMGLELSGSKRYWASRGKALAFSAVYAVQWELGPLSETSIGNFGRYDYYSENTERLTNGTGIVDLVVTPVIGTAWLVGEDALDKFAIKRLERVSGNRAYLSAISILNPTRSLANILRFKPPYYRDMRQVGGR